MGLNEKHLVHHCVKSTHLRCEYLNNGLIKWVRRSVDNPTTLRLTPFPAKPYQLLPHVRYKALEKCLRLAIYKPVVTKIRGIFTGLKLQFKRNRVQYLSIFENSKARSSEFKYHTLK